MEIFVTVVTGFAIFALGQITVKLVIDPVQEFRRVIADISHADIEYARIYGNPGAASQKEEKEASIEFRKLASRLNAQMYLIPAYKYTSKVFGLPSQKNVDKATGHLIALSNGFGGNKDDSNRGIRNLYRSQHLCNALGIYILEQERLDLKLEMEFY